MAKFDFIRRAFQSDLKPRARLVLNCLILHCNQEGACFPSIRTIAAECGYGVSTVKRALNDLLEAGYIEKEARFDERKRGGQTSNLYVLRTVETAPQEKPEPAETPAPQRAAAAIAEGRPALVASNAIRPQSPVPGRPRHTPKLPKKAAEAAPPRGFSALFDLAGQRAAAHDGSFVFHGWTGGQSIFIPP